MFKNRSFKKIYGFVLSSFNLIKWINQCFAYFLVAIFERSLVDLFSVDRFPLFKAIALFPAPWELLVSSSFFCTFVAFLCFDFLIFKNEVQRGSTT